MTAATSWPKRRACVFPRASRMDAPTHAAWMRPRMQPMPALALTAAQARTTMSPAVPLWRVLRRADFHSCARAYAHAAYAPACSSVCSVRARLPFERRVQSCNRIRAGQDGRRCRPALCRGKQYAGVGVAASHPRALQRAACTAHDSAPRHATCSAVARTRDARLPRASESARSGLARSSLSLGRPRRLSGGCGVLWQRGRR